MSRESNSVETEYIWSIHTYMWAKRERNRWISCLLIVRKTVSSPPFQKMVGNDDIQSMMCGYVTGLLQLFISSQIDWAFSLVCGCHVFFEDLNSNTVFKLFILIWSYEGMKVMNLGYWKSYEYFTITPICHISSRFS